MRGSVASLVASLFVTLACAGDAATTRPSDQPPPSDPAGERASTPTTTATPEADAPRGIGLSAGHAHTCRLYEGAITCWGSSAAGVLAAPEGDEFVAISSRSADNCALRRDGSLACWGEYLGTTAAPDGRFTQVEVGLGFACALHVDGRAQCWGPADEAQLAAPEGHFVELAIGNHHGCARTEAGAIRCWGSDRYGESQPPAGDGYQLVDAGEDHTCAVDSKGATACWGGQPTHREPWTKPPEGLATMIAIGGGDHHTCGLQVDGEVRCWGVDYDGSLAPPAGVFVALAVGTRHACALRGEGDGDVRCWGYSEQAAHLSTDEFARVIAGTEMACALDRRGAPTCWGGYGQRPAGEFAELSLAGEWSDQWGCGISSAGALSCWGDVDYNRSGIPEGVFEDVSINETVGCALRDDGRPECWGPSWCEHRPNGKFTQIEVGPGCGGCGIREDGTLACWGGDAGLGKTPPGSFVDVAVASFSDACALADDGAVRCWGDNTVSPPGKFTAIAGAHLAYCGLTEGGEIQCWVQPDEPLPPEYSGYAMLIPAGPSFEGIPPGPFEDVSVGDHFVCGKWVDGGIECWGDLQIVTP